MMEDADLDLHQATDAPSQPSQSLVVNMLGRDAMVLWHARGRSHKNKIAANGHSAPLMGARSFRVSAGDVKVTLATRPVPGGSHGCIVYTCRGLTQIPIASSGGATHTFKIEHLSPEKNHSTEQSQVLHSPAGVQSFTSSGRAAAASSSSSSPSPSPSPSPAAGTPPPDFAHGQHLAGPTMSPYTLQVLQFMLDCENAEEEANDVKSKEKRAKVTLSAPPLKFTGSDIMAPPAAVPSSLAFDAAAAASSSSVLSHSSPAATAVSHKRKKQPALLSTSEAKPMCDSPGHEARDDAILMKIQSAGKHGVAAATPAAPTSTASAHNKRLNIHAKQQTAAPAAASSSSSSQASTSSPRDVIIIGVYNYKGGVGKTTNLIQLATVLARQGHTTLMVDADPQCNLTSFYKPRVDDIDSETGVAAPMGAEDEADVDLDDTADWGVGSDSHIQAESLSSVEAHDLKSLRNDNSNPSLHSALNPVFTGNIHGLKAQTLEPLPGEKLNNNLYLLAGSTHIVRFEQALSMVDANVGTAVPMLGAFRKLIHLTAAAVGARTVLVDFGPSSGILNRVFVMSCDYILPPCFADFYSICSADGFLTNLLPQWIKWQRVDVLDKQASRLADGDSDAHRSFAFHAEPPRVLPFIVTAYKMNFPGKCVAKPSSQWIMDLQMLAYSDTLSPEIKAAFYPIDGFWVIPLLEHVGQLIQYSHETKRAVIELTSDILRKELNLKTKDANDMMRRVQIARTRYGSLAKALKLLP